MASVEHCLYCFENLAATLEKRTPMSLDQVIESWAAYPKGLDDLSSSESSDNESEDETSTNKRSQPNSKRSKLDGPTFQRAAALIAGSNSSSPASSGSSLSAKANGSSSNITTPDADDDEAIPSFTPVGIGRKTSQRATIITESPLFVTWNKASSRTGVYQLRGCIGTFEPQPLAEGLSSYAITSAVHDGRFNPVVLSELPLLEVAVTLLTDFESCIDPMDWELGVHGLRISFYHRNRRFGSCYLPDVAPEQGWTKEETIVSLMRKGGWSGKTEKWKEVADLKLVRFQGKLESVKYDEYKRWKDWAVAEAKSKK